MRWEKRVGSGATWNRPASLREWGYSRVVHAAACWRGLFGGKSVADNDLPLASAISSNLPFRQSGIWPLPSHDSIVV